MLLTYWEFLANFAFLLPNLREIPALMSYACYFLIFGKRSLNITLPGETARQW